MDEKKQKPEEVAPPDGGWGWCVVFGSFCCNVIVDGIIFSFGLLLPELSRDLGVSQGRLAWAGSLLAGFYLIAGPVVSGFANTFGCRPVTIAGTLIASAAFAAASQAHSATTLCLTFGVAGGIGFGFIYLPAVVTVGYYFQRRRAFATGLAVCGSGVGTFLVSPFMSYLLGRYEWRGTLLVLSGLILNCALFGALFRPLPLKKVVEEEEKEKKDTLGLHRIQEAYNREGGLRRGSLDVIGKNHGALPHFSLSLPEICSSNLDEVDKNSPPPSYNEVVGADQEEMISFLKPPSYIRYNPLPTLVAPQSKRGRYDRGLGPDFSRPFYRQDILYSASILNLPQFKESNNDLAQYAAKVTKIPEPEPEGAFCCPAVSPAMRDTFRQMLDLSLLRSATFLLLGLGGFLTLAGFFVPFMFVVDRAVREEGIPLDSATYILPAIGLTNTVGRVFCGWISDRPGLDALTINNGALIVGGLVTILSTFFSTIEWLLVYAAVFGFSIGCFATLRSIVIVELLGLERLTNAFGLLLLFQGLASIVGAPVAGMFFDMTGSYDATFYISGSLILVSGLLGMPLRYISQWEKRRKSSVVCSNGIVISVTGPNNTDPIADV